MNSLLDKAVEIATFIHRNQKRRSGEQYIIHPITVMNLVKKLGGNEVQQIIAILHDTLEDVEKNNSGVTYQKLKHILNRTFGNTITKAIEKLNLETSTNKQKYSIEDIKKIAQRNNYDYTDEQFIIKVTKYINSIYSIINDKLLSKIKIADIISNLIDNPTKQQKQKYCTSLQVLGKNSISDKYC